MKYTTNLKQKDFVTKLNNFEKKPNVFVTIRGKCKNGKMILSSISDSYYIPYIKSYFIYFNADNSITVKKKFGFDHILIAIMSILIVMLGVAMIFWYDVNILIITAFTVGVSLFVILMSFVYYKLFINKTLEDDFGCIIQKRLQ